MAVKKMTIHIKWITLFFSLFFGASYAFAETNSKIAAEYGSLSTTYSVGGNTAKLDLSGTSIRATIGLSKTISVSGATSSMTGDLSGINMELNNTSFGILYLLFNDINVKAGTGSRLGIGLSSSDTRLKTRVNGTDYSTKSSSLLIGAGLESALSEGISFTGQISGDSKDFNPIYSLGITYDTGLGELTAFYTSAEETVETVNVKTTGYTISYGFRF